MPKSMMMMGMIHCTPMREKVSMSLWRGNFETMKPTRDRLTTKVKRESRDRRESVIL